jgi:hypothetical protein
MAGWQPYLDIILKDKSGAIEAAGIYGQNGAEWAVSPTLKGKAPAAEITGLVSGVKDVSKFQASGITYTTQKYFYLNTLSLGSGSHVVGKKGPKSIVLALSKQAIIVAIIKDNANAGNVTAVDFISSDLQKKNF